VCGACLLLLHKVFCEEALQQCGQTGHRFHHASSQWRSRRWTACPISSGTALRYQSHTKVPKVSRQDGLSCPPPSKRMAAIGKGSNYLGSFGLKCCPSATIHILRGMIQNSGLRTNAGIGMRPSGVGPEQRIIARISARS
jgi:hypothetical protein